MVLPSEVYRKGTFLGPVFTSRTRHSLYLASVLSFPSILIRRCLQMVSTSFMVRAYFRRFLRNRAIGRDSPCLWGPELGLMVKTPPSLSSIHDLGAAKRFKCFLGPLGILRFYFSCRSESSNISSHHHYFVEVVRRNFEPAKLWFVEFF